MVRIISFDESPTQSVFDGRFLSLIVLTVTFLLVKTDNFMKLAQFKVFAPTPATTLGSLFMKPGMFQNLYLPLNYLSSRNPCVSISYKDVADKIESIFKRTDISDGELDAIYPGVQLLIRISYKGEIAHQHHKHQHSQSPDIGFLASMIPLLHKLRGHVAWSATKEPRLHIKANTLVLLSMQVLKPKSISFGVKSLSTITFSSLMSRCAIRFL